VESGAWWLVVEGMAFVLFFVFFLAFFLFCASSFSVMSALGGVGGVVDLRILLECWGPRWGGFRF
jgi:hypothetical protein